MEENKIHKDIENKMEEKSEQKLEEKKTEAKMEEKKEGKKHIIKKEDAIAQGMSLHASKKHCMYICNFIKHKPIDLAMKNLEEVIHFKRPIPFKGEIPHRGKGMMSGRYPVKASKMFIALLKGLKGNVLVNGLDLDKTRIYLASASWASRPLKKGGSEAKRTNVILKAKEFSK